MRTVVLTFKFLLATAFGVFSSIDVAADDQVEFFETKIRPILIESCYECHSEESGDAQGGLLLDSKQGLRTGGDTGPAIVAERPTESLLLEAISYHNRDLEMPPDGKLPDAVIEDFQQWIANGAFDPRELDSSLPQRPEFNLAERFAEHWAWQPVRSRFDSVDSIDAFILRELKSKDLQPAPMAAPEVLVRRIYLDLIGLPPEPTDVDAFRLAWSNNERHAIAELVDRLLADSRFGEHWAAGWLDVVRFSETKGHVTDIERPYAWKYRDYVIDAFNDDLAFDRFIVEHVAGDLLPESEWRRGRGDIENVAPTATGALFMHEMHFMSVDPVKQRWDEINAQIEVVGKAFLGLTLDCARCHDHKFDAVSQRDYYALAGFFYSTEQGTVRVGPRASYDDEQQAEIAKLEESYYDYLNSKRNQRRQAQTPKVGSDTYFPISEELGIQSPGDASKLFQLLRQLEEADPTWAQWVRSAADVAGQDVPLLIRGDHKKLGEATPRRFLEAIGGTEPPDQTTLGPGSGRLWLAQQIANPQNPLTARVWANRIWQNLFGRGIVSTPNNFGSMGSRPTHPELLDYLATRLVDANWSTKTLVREVMLSDAYLRSSSPASLPKTTLQMASEIDPENQFLYRQNVRRMTAEQLRDSMLQICELLASQTHGPSVNCFVPSYATANKPTNVPRSGPLDGDARRSIYIKVRRNFYDPFLKTFDFPDRGKSIGRRQVTSAPSQALAMMNSPLVHQLSTRWGEQIAKSEMSIEERIRWMWLRSLSRLPNDREMDDMRRLHRELEVLVSDSVELWKEMAHVILNHPELLLIK